MTRMLTMREFFQLRGASQELYQHVAFGAEPMACLARLRPRLIAHARAQRGNRLVYLGLRISMPPTDDELEGLAELRGMRGLKVLELDFIEDPTWDQGFVFGEAHNVDFCTRVRRMTTLVHEVLVLELESLTIKIPHDERGSLEDLVSKCVLANSDTLRHFSLPKSIHGPENPTEKLSSNAPFAATLCKLESLRFEGNIDGVAVLCDPDYVFQVQTERRSISERTWRYLDMASESEREYSDGGMPFPFILPNTLEGLALASLPYVTWTCPPNVAFLRMLLSNRGISGAISAHVPPEHSVLAQLVLDASPWPATDWIPLEQKEEEENAYKVWLEQATLPGLHTIVLRGHIGHRELVDLMRLVARLPHLKHLYVCLSDGKLSEDKRALLRPFVELLVAGLSRGIQFHEGTESTAPNLEAAFLLERGLSILSPCDQPHTVVENSQDGQILQLQPTTSRALAHQRQRHNANLPSVR